MATEGTGRTIEELHALYVSESRRTIGFNMAFERDWWDWIKFQTPPFTQDDLRVVIRAIHVGIRAGKRNPGALKFENLVRNPQRFADELAEVRSVMSANAKKPKVNSGKQTALSLTGRNGSDMDNRGFVSTDNTNHKPTVVRADEALERSKIADLLGEWRKNNL